MVGFDGAYNALVGLCIGQGDAEWLTELERLIEPVTWAGYRRVAVNTNVKRARTFRWEVPKRAISGPQMVTGLILFTPKGVPFHFMPTMPRSFNPGDVVEVTVPAEG